MMIEFHASEHVLQEPYGDEPSHYFVHVRAELRDGEDVVGRARACIFRHGCADEKGVSLFEVGDSFDQDKHSAWCAVMDEETECLRESLSSDGIGFRTNDILYVERMQITAPHRGKGYGLLLMQRLIRRFGGGCAMVVIEPHPTNQIASHEDDAEWRERMDWDQLATSTAVGIRKLRKHWGALGFKPVPGSKTHFYLDLESQELPDDVEIAS